MMRRVGLLAVLAVVLATAGWWVFLISPKNGQIDDLRQELNAAIDNESRLRVRINELEGIRQSEVEYLAALGQLDTLIPERPQLESFIEQFYELTNESGVVLQTFSPSFPVAEEGSELRTIAVSAAIEGSFFEVLGFLFGLNDLERLVRIDAVAVNSLLQDVRGTVLAASVEMSIFTLADLVPIIEELEAITPEGQAPQEGTEEAAATDVEAIGVMP